MSTQALENKFFRHAALFAMDAPVLATAQALKV
jgi:hypothetical protein